MDFFTVQVLTWRGVATYYVLFLIELETRRVFGEGSLRRALSEFTEYYHSEPDHDGSENLFLFPRGPSGDSSSGHIKCKQRLGGLLKCDARAA